MLHFLPTMKTKHHRKRISFSRSRPQRINLSAWQNGDSILTGQCSRCRLVHLFTLSCSFWCLSIVPYVTITLKEKIILLFSSYIYVTTAWLRSIRMYLVSDLSQQWKIRLSHSDTCKLMRKNNEINRKRLTATFFRIIIVNVCSYRWIEQNMDAFS